jgi:hypothetical protein
MSRNLLEPHAPAPHIWPHWREAFRSWYVGRKGRQPSRSATGSEPRGKGPGIDDLLRVGRVLRALDLLDDAHELTRHGEMVLEVAMGIAPRTAPAEGGSKGVEVLVARVVRRLRAAGVVAPPPRTAMARWRFVDTEGQEASHAYLVEEA